ncbi:MAG: hypothetical protein E7Z64_05505 [Thermoplasmata archaeon]|nr:hypothetical protein [Thermoplasmata archaeon]
METRAITKEELVELFRIGATRKMEEHEIFVMRALEHPERAEVYSELQSYVDIESRYYDLARHYYAGEFSYFENGENEDLLLLTKVSELPPKLYAEYLREIDPSQRVYEKITHGYLLSLKHNISEVKEAMQ